MRESELNLIPSDIIEHELLRERLKFWVFVISGCLLVLLSLHIVIKIVNRSIDQSLKVLAVTSEDLAEKMTGFRELEKRENELMNMKENIRFLSQKTPTIKVINAIDRALNDKIILSHLDVEYDYLSSAATAEKDETAVQGYFRSSPRAKTSSSQMQNANRLIIKGNAESNTDIASMLTSLSKTPVFNYARLKYSKTVESEKGKGIIFEIECSLSSQLNQGGI